MTIEEQKKFSEMQEDLSTVKSDVAEIKSALLGDGYLGKGLVGEFKRHEENIKLQDDRIAKLEAMVKQIKWLAIGAGGGAVLGIKQLIDWIMKLTNHQ